MKGKLFFSIFILLFSVYNVRSQSWTTLNSGTTNTLIGVSAVNTTTCYVSGSSGIILKTTNGGASWNSQTSGTTEDLYYILFTDSNTGYAVGNNRTAIRTTDGGATWSAMTTPAATGVGFRHIHFVDSLTGYITGSISGSPGTILKTIDGGNTWGSLTTSPASSNGIYSVFFTSPSNGYANDYDGNILKTTDGGTSWAGYATGTSNHFNGNIYFTNASTGFVSGLNGAIYKTSNTGTSWSALNTGTVDALTGLEFYDSNNGFAVGGDVAANTGKILRTTDGGTTWTDVPLNTGTHRLCKIDFFDSNTGYAVGLNGTILKYSSCQAGSYWITQNSGTTNTLISVSAVNTTTSYVSGSSGIILKTTNGGASWNPQISGTTEDLYYILFTDFNTGYAVGNNKTAIRTTDGGATWSSMPTPAAIGVGFRHIYFVDSLTGYITGSISGSPGTILKTVDGGNSWGSLTTSPASSNGIYSVFFTSPSNGYANDYDGNILQTTDGGTSWAGYATGTSNHFNGNIYFTNASTGFVSGMNGAIYKTNNTGTSWSALNTGTADALTGLQFYDSINGFAVGGDISANTSKMIRTTDGGATWTDVPLTTGTHRLCKIDFFDSNTGYAVGLNGTILKYTSCSSYYTVAVSSINASSFGVCDGAANATIMSSNSSGYSCLWSTGQTTSSISNLCAGTYTITVTDSLGLTTSEIVVITEPADSTLIDTTFILSTVSSNVSASGYCDGSATVSPTGGTPPYTYLWSTGDLAASISGLCSNVYYITVNDSTGQSVSSTVYISEPTDTITDSIVYPPVDTLYIDPIDTCIVDFNIPIDSAYITSFTVTDSMTILVDWTLWQNGVGVTITTETQYTNMGFNLMVLTLHCTDLSRELYATIIEDGIDTNPVTTGINQLTNSTLFRTYPNPFKDKINMDFILHKRGDVSFKMMNSLGQIIYSVNQSFEKGENKITLNTENLESGVYFIQTAFDGQTKVSKIIK